MFKKNGISRIRNHFWYKHPIKKKQRTKMDSVPY